jgi:hypothetical protein
MIQRSRFGVLPLLILTVHSALAQSPGSEKTLVVMLGTGTPLPDPARSGQRRQNGNQVANLKRSEARQLRNTKRGNAIVFETVCEALRPRLLKVAQRITRNREDAEDAVQDSLMRAYLHIEDRRKPDGASGFRKAPIFERPASWSRHAYVSSGVTSFRFLERNFENNSAGQRQKAIVFGAASSFLNIAGTR